MPSASHPPSAKRTAKHRDFATRPTPGTPHDLLHTHPEAHDTVVRAYGYGPGGYEQIDVATPTDLEPLRQRYPNIWVDVAGLRTVSMIAALGEYFALHPLTLEDVLHTHQRTKVEDYGAYHFIVVRMAPVGDEDPEQLSLFLGEGWVVTFQERIGDDLDPVRQRLRAGRGKICTLGADHLTYAILDAAVDAYFPLLERIGEELEDLEDSVVLQPREEVLSRVYTLRRRMLQLRRAVWPLREAIANLVRDEDSTVIGRETRTYMRDVYDHTVQVIDLMETYRELSSNLMDVYLSSMSNRLNEVMKVLTIITTIFIPLSFICGVYGMNFNTAKSPYNMPELNWEWGYPMCLALMLALAVGELIYFRRKGWLGKV